MKIAPFKLERYFAKHEFSAPYLLCTSDCESMELRELLEFEPDAADRFASLWLGYTESLGDPELRQAISTLYNGITSDQVLVHSGAEEAIFIFMNIALSPGDQVIVHAPYYQSLGEVARSIGAEVAEWTGDPAHAWELDIEDLKSILTPRTKVVVVNFPHNPTGLLPGFEFVRELSELSEKHGFIIFSDEVYRGLELDPSERLPSMADMNNRAVSLGVMSKTYGLAGLRIGWISTRNKHLFSELAAFKDYTTICNSAPSEFLAILALKNADTIVERNLQIIRRNLDHLDAFFKIHEDMFIWHKPKAGSVAFPALLKGTVTQFCTDLVQKAGILLLPGTLYNEELNSFRIGFGRRNLPEAIQKFEDYLQSNLVLFQGLTDSNN
ncbi:aminotransferase class I/II-fold pyridoxal phosphate-dependent enzyme [Desulfonatronovibrio magnus]|uniref:aminotransferase class I/II-fold pyridoxal phosphate-dependent enzyme n=1 Tax=Desulfonatronovibrio magnus TaxID=698827 RepID=UPI0005EAEF7E|nr:aminotransferase class I/II-fold pyridoxal phosphate-dependent enzyme [Desulfonatronovibrio magnus]